MSQERTEHPLKKKLAGQLSLTEMNKRLASLGIPYSREAISQGLNGYRPLPDFVLQGLSMIAAEINCGGRTNA